MPNLHAPQAEAATVEFVYAPALDILNALYFAFLAKEYEGVGAPAVAMRQRMDPALAAELDALFSYPRGEPGIMGALTDTTFVHREAWDSVEALLDYVRDLPAAGSPDPERPGIQGLAAYALRWPCDDGAPTGPELDRLSRRAVADALIDRPDGRDEALALFDDAEQVRARIMRLIRRFYDEHYRPDEDRRAAILRRSVERHSAAASRDPQELMNTLAGRYINCIDEAPGAYDRFLFVPSIDIGVYNSCADMPPVHGFFYAPDAALAVDAGGEPDVERMALVYRALADEQRLRILRELRDGELYVQEIVQRTGIAQSVASRHLTFMKAAGLVIPRRQNNMKYYSLNQEMRDELSRAIDVYIPPQTPARKSGGA